MIGSLFSVEYAMVNSRDWKSKKAALLPLLRDGDFERAGLAAFETDRHNNGDRYVGEFCAIFDDELQRLGRDLRLNSLKIDSIWAVRYRRGDFHAVHNHRSTGYSGILYVDYDEAEHTPTFHVGPWNHPITDTTQFATVPVREGSMTMVPSSVLHFTYPNESDKIRTVVAFDATAA